MPGGIGSQKRDHAGSRAPRGRRRRSGCRRARRRAIMPASTDAHPAGGRGDQVRGHPHEEALHEHAERHVAAEGLEARPQHADVAGPEADGAARPRARRGAGGARMRRPCARRSRASPGAAAMRGDEARASGSRARSLRSRRSRSCGISAISNEDPQQPARDRGGHDRAADRVAAGQHAGAQQHAEDDAAPAGTASTSARGRRPSGRPSAGAAFPPCAAPSR